MLRINKAKEWGASFVKNWHDAHVTHAILDLGMPYQGLVDFLNLDGGIPVCIRYAFVCG